jgi:hypothetical protein
MVEKEERCIVGMLEAAVVDATSGKALARAVTKVRFATERPREEVRIRRLVEDNMVEEEVTIEEEIIVMSVLFTTETEKVRS